LLLVALLTAFAGISGLRAQSADTLSIDLETALKIALSENPTVKVADMEITRKEYAKNRPMVHCCLS